MAPWAAFIYMPSLFATSAAFSSLLQEIIAEMLSGGEALVLETRPSIVMGDVGMPRIRRLPLP